MKKIFVTICILFAINAAAQTKYQYYFYAIRPTGKAEVELSGRYPETDSLLIEKIEVNKKNDTTFYLKKFSSYSDAFNALSALGMEYVEFRNLPMIGGFGKMLIGDIKTDWVIWRKEVK
jgi:hypothetical protein